MKSTTTGQYIHIEYDQKRIECKPVVHTFVIFYVDEGFEGTFCDMVGVDVTSMK